MKSVVITTIAPRMNELVTSDRGLLVDFDRTGTRNFTTCYHVGNRNLSMSEVALRSISRSGFA